MTRGSTFLKENEKKKTLVTAQNICFMWQFLYFLTETTSRAVQNKFPPNVFIQQILSESQLSHASIVWATEQEASHRPRPGVGAVDTDSNVTTEISGIGKKRTREGRRLRSASAVHVQGSLKLAKMSCYKPRLLHKAPFTPHLGLGRHTSPMMTAV